jgi:hypothetical protein
MYAYIVCLCYTVDSHLQDAAVLCFDTLQPLFRFLCLHSAPTPPPSLPTPPQAVGGLVPALLSDSHTRISEVLSGLSGCDPTSPGFDVAVMEVVEALDAHNKVGAHSVWRPVSVTVCFCTVTTSDMAVVLGSKRRVCVTQKFCKPVDIVFSSQQVKG